MSAMEEEKKTPEEEQTPMPLAENDKTPSKTPSPAKQKRNLWIVSGVFLGVAALVIAIATIGFFATRLVGSSSSKTYLDWNGSEAGFYGEDGSLLVDENGTALGRMTYDEHVDDASVTYGEIVSVLEPNGAYSFLLPSYVNDLNSRYIAPTEKGKSLFGAASMLHEIGSKSLYREIGAYAFSDMDELEEVGLASEASGSQTIGSFALSENPKLKTVSFAHNLVSLEEGALKNDALLTETNIKRTKLEKIGASAFEGCSSLLTLCLPSSLKSIGAYAFQGTAIESLYFDGEKSLWETVEKDANCLSGSSITAIVCSDETIAL